MRPAYDHTDTDVPIARPMTPRLLVGTISGLDTEVLDPQPGQVLHAARQLAGLMPRASGSADDR